MKYLRKILPYMEQVTGVLMVLAGIYVIYYQMALLLKSHVTKVGFIVPHC